ncbi:type II/IV secretion system protein TadC [Paenibacillus pini JCM 16418]|uniref:Type II/IV secretion system protein TadC n=1 Tax=Paenibacillus pini JCM 16418 TaxID=1236976 RepID=W7YUF2_9BACL|nr:type II/IV secretion system protein TadC [Paenibacillus pini JCM 16418]
MKIMAAILLIVLVGSWVLLNAQAGSKYRRITKLPMEGIRLRPFLPPILSILDKFGIMARFPMFFFKIQRSIQKVYGNRLSAELTMLYVGEMISYSWILLMTGCVLTFMLGGNFGMILGVILAVILPLSMVRDLHTKVQKRDQDILMELPELLSKIVLLVGAGETVQKAIAHCVERRKTDTDHPYIVN